jgi:hypothetical protein
MFAFFPPGDLKVDGKLIEKKQPAATEKKE